MLAEDVRLVIEEGASSGALNIPYASDEKEEEYIYMPPKLLEGRDVQVLVAPISDITSQEIQGIFPRELRVESSKSRVSDTNVFKTISFKKLVWQNFKEESLHLMRQKKQERPQVDNDDPMKEIEDDTLNMFDTLTPSEGRESSRRWGF